MENSELKRSGVFLAEYATCLLGSGVHTSRVIRNTKRIGAALGLEVYITTLMKTITLTVHDKSTLEMITEVVDIPELPIRFVLNSELSALSWDTYDRSYTLSHVQEEFFRILQKYEKNSFLRVLLLISFSNSCFCALFGGDIYAALFVFVATACGFFLRKILVGRFQMNIYISTATAAFLSSIIASLSDLMPNAMSGIAIATSVLYLIPGVPLINGTIDIIEGHTLSGISRLTKAVLLIFSIAFGLAFSLLIQSKALT